MRRTVLSVSICLALVACDGIPGGAAGPAGGGPVREYLVIGSTMSFERCRELNGLIIRDQGSPMVACDPSVTSAVMDGVEP